MNVSGKLRPSSSAQALAQVLGARVHVPVVIPRTDIAGSMRLVDRREALAITVETRLHFDELKLPVDPTAISAPGVMNEWNCEIAVRHLAVAVRDPADTSKPLAPLDEWNLCDDDQIAKLWQEYQDLRERLDPLSDLERLTDQELAAMQSAAKKKQADSLQSYGSRRLALFAITTAELPAS